MTIAADRAYETLLGRITRGELTSGAFLVEADLARDIGVSRTPVREAIKRLTAEGLVHSEGRRRATVRDFSEGRVQELFELRARLEGYAAHRAATRVSAAQLAELRELACAMEACVALDRASAAEHFADLNDRFHQVILDAAGADYLETALRPVLQFQLVLLQRYRHTIDEHLERSCWHHRELIRSFELRDAALAELQMNLHMLSARNAGGSPTPGVAS